MDYEVYSKKETIQAQYERDDGTNLDLTIIDVEQDYDEDKVRSYNLYIYADENVVLAYNRETGNWTVDIVFFNTLLSVGVPNKFAEQILDKADTLDMRE